MKNPKVGDRVAVYAIGTHVIRYVGKIVSVQYSERCFVAFEDRDNAWFHRTQLVRIKTPLLPVPQDLFVNFLNSGSICAYLSKEEADREWKSLDDSGIHKKSYKRKKNRAWRYTLVHTLED